MTGCCGMENVRKKILFVGPTLPQNFGSGGAMRSYQMYCQLTEFCDVDLLTCNENLLPQSDVSDFVNATSYTGNYLGHILINRFPPILSQKKDLSADFLKHVPQPDAYDYVVVRYYNSAYWLGLFSLPNLILDCDDCYLEIFLSKFQDSNINPFVRLYTYLQCQLFKSGYLKLISQVNRLIFSRHSQYSSHLTDSFIVPNQLNSPPDSLPPPVLPQDPALVRILFVGVLNYEPNIEGMEHFLKNIWPKVVAKKRNAELLIVGSSLDEKLKQKWSKHPQVNVLGYIQNIEAVYASIDITIVPVYRGSGTHIKIMESLKYGKPAVLSHISIRGYESVLHHDKNILIAKDDANYADILIKLIENKHYRETLAQAGSDTFFKHFCFQNSKNHMKQVIAAEAF